MTLILLDPRSEESRAPDRRTGPAPALRLPLILGAILLLGAVLRLTGVNWDDGHHLHPDERFLTMVENSIQLPTSPLQYFDSATSPLNPYNKGYNSFVYGTVPLFLVRFIAEIGNWNNYGDVTLLGRVLSALFDLGTILMVFVIGRRLFDWRVGALAAFLVAVTPMHIQQSHYYTMDTFLVFFLTVAFYFAVRVAQEGGTGNYVLLGVFYGLATASKINAATFGLVVLVACAIRAWQLTFGQPSRGTARGWPTLRGVEEPVSGFALALMAAFVVFRIGEPYAFVGPAPWDVGLHPKFLADLDNWRKVGTGEVDYPPSIQWANRTAYVYPFEQLVRWGMGAPLGLASWAGVALAAVCVVWRPRRYLLLALPLVWIGFNWWYWGSAFLKPMRYFLPIYPELILLGAWLLLALLAWARSPAVRAALGTSARLRAALARLPGRLRAETLGAHAALGLLLLVAGYTTLYALAYTTIYTRTTTRVAASEWIYANFPPGTRVANEHWDDPVPLNLPNRPAGPYAGPQLELYAEDEPQKREKLVATLDQSDVIAITSSRLYSSIPRIPERWPMAIEYYRLLCGPSLCFDATTGYVSPLGFELVATITSYPRLGPFEVRDDRAEELWINYDHPKVLLFKKTPQYSSAQARALLEAVPLDSVIKGLKPIRASTHGLLMTPEMREVQQAGGTWSDIIDRGNVFNRFAGLSWWLLAVALGLVAFPLTWAVFGRLADRGYGIAKVLAIALLAWSAWLLASVRALPYTRETILLVLGLIVGASALVVWRRRAAFLADVRARWELFALAEVVFAAAYVFFHGIRMANPDLWHGNYGGEKPMDFAYLNAILKSTYFPPYDPWLAGGYINYYYFGQVLVATLIKLTGTVPAVAYNLAVALFFALVVGGAFSFAFNWLLGRRGAEGARPRRIAALGWAELGGLLAAFFVAIIGNLDGLVQVIENLGKASGAPTTGGIPGVTGLVRAVQGLGVALSGAYPMPPFDFWRSTRVIGPEDPGPITEFPYFTFLYGDLHAHLLALPLTLLALHIALALVRSDGLAPVWRALTRTLPGREATRTATFSLSGEAPPSVPDPASESGRSHSRWEGVRIKERLADVATQPVLWLLALGGLVVGLLRATNTWDFPTYLLLLVGAGAIAEYRAFQARARSASSPALGTRHSALGTRSAAPGTRQSLPGVLARVAVIAAVLFVVSNLAIRPYLSNFGLFYTGVEPIKVQTSLVHYLTVLGFFLFAVTSLVVYETWVLRRRIVPLLATTPLLEQAGPVQGFWSPPNPNGWRLTWGAVAGYGLLAGLLVVVGLLALGKMVPAVVALLLLALAWLVPWHRQHADRLLVLGMIVTALALTAAVEFVALKGDVGRMNTVFKFYLQVWVLLGLAAAVIGVRLLRRWRPSGTWWRWWSVAAAVLLAGCLIYPVQATPVKLGYRFDRLPPTDDGMAFMQTAVYHDRNQALPLIADYRAIRWMQDNIPGSPVVLEANTGLYKWGSRVSIYTGLPTVVGWDWHQRQQRGDFAWMVEERVRDVTQMYDAPDPRLLLPLLRKHDVEYIYVGPLERAYYSEAGLRKFRELVGTVLDLVYVDPEPIGGQVNFNQGVQIYRVRQDAVRDQLAAGASPPAPPR